MTSHTCHQPKICLRHIVTNCTWRTLRLCKGLYKIIYGGRVQFVHTSQELTLAGGISYAPTRSRPWSVTFQLQKQRESTFLSKPPPYLNQHWFAQGSQASPSFPSDKRKWQVWHNNDSEKLMYWDKNPPQCHLANWPGINTALHWEMPETNCPSHGIADLSATKSSIHCSIYCSIHSSMTSEGPLHCEHYHALLLCPAGKSSMYE
jgi:hypothetical protein